MSEQNIRNAIHNGFSKMLGKPLKMSEYRQMAVLISEKHLPGKSSLYVDTDYTNVAFDLQTGHSTETTQIHYGKSNNDLPNTKRLIKTKAYETSLGWQKIFGIHKPVESEPRINDPISAQLLENDNNDEPLSAFLHEDIPIENSDREMLIALKKTTLDSGTWWKSPMQRQCAHAILSAESYIIAQETGFGKSLLVMLMANLPNSGITLYTATLKATVDDFVQRCDRANIEICKLSDLTFTSVINCKIIVSYAETLVEYPFKQIIQNLANSESLKRIIVDEAHEVISSSDFRLALRKFQGLGTLNIGLKLISATLPQRYVNALSAGVFFRNFKVLYNIPCF